MKAKIFYVLLVAIMVYAGCSVETDQVIVEEVAKNQLVVKEPGYEMSITIPDQCIGGPDSRAVYNHDLAELNVNLGEHFNIIIRNEKTDLVAFKEKLKKEQLFEYKFTLENKFGFVYQSFLPDGTIYSSNFIQVFELNDTFYTAQNAPGEYSVEAIKTMNTTVLNINSL